MVATRIDGHAHLHRDFRLSEVLAAAKRNFAGETGVLLLAQPDEAPVFSLLEEQLPSLDDWAIDQPDPTSYVFQQNDIRIAMIAGRQIVTCEKLEVLALGTTACIPHQQSLRETLDAAYEQNAIPVLPWGFGKWWFERGKVISRWLNEQVSEVKQRVWLGDNGCRPRGTTSPVLKQAEDQGLAVLAGSDPLPLKSHETRLGSYTSRILEPFDATSPADWLRANLAKPSTLTLVGRRQGILPFLQDQIRIRLRQKR